MNSENKRRSTRMRKCEIPTKNLLSPSPASKSEIKPIESVSYIRIGYCVLCWVCMMMMNDDIDASQKDLLIYFLECSGYLLVARRERSYFNIRKGINF